MSPYEQIIPDTTFDGGTMDVNADKIEARLNTVWQQASSSFSTDMPVAKLCLSTMVIIADSQSRSLAEQLSYELAAGYPSRVILVVLEEEREVYSAFVRTSCSRDKETGMVRCWEVIELDAHVGHLDKLPGALRSLLVGSVPVVSVDYRDFQTTPDFDAVIMDLSYYYFVNADVVPSENLKKTYLPFRWYRTLAIRELIGELIGRVAAYDCHVYPRAFETFVAEGFDTYSDLLSGWLVHRLGAEQPVQTGSHVVATCGSFQVSLTQLPQEDFSQVLRIQFSDGETGRVRQVGSAEDGSPVYEASYKQITIERAANATRFSRYLIGAIHDRSEFQEFAATNNALDRIIRKQ